VGEARVGARGVPKAQGAVIARVVAYVPDLLFGSSVLGAIQAAGHEAVLVPDLERLREALPSADALVVDLTADAAVRARQVSECRPPGFPALAFYSHVEADVRALAERTGFDLVVPRSRMAREGPQLVERLIAAGR
jgi:hypothetical protein